jgi:hypothetical protein
MMLDGLLGLRFLPIVLYWIEWLEVGLMEGC